MERVNTYQMILQTSTPFGREVIVTMILNILGKHKEEIRDLDGIKGQSDSSTRFASPMKMVHSS